MHTTYYLILIASIATFASVLSLGAYMLFSHMAMLDEPDARSNHTRPVVTGVGVGFIATILGFLMVVNAPAPLIIGGIILLIISCIDDRTPQPAAKRFGFQLIAVILALHVFGGQVFGGLLPVWLDMIVTALLWLWFINLTNFMDGIDEISVMQGTSMTGGIVLLTLVFSAMPQAVEVDALVIGLGVLSFYPWNRHPAMCFMGDSGSIPLGYLMGYLLLALSSAGLWHVALILPAYYLTDASVTLARRALRKETLWVAHSQHFYQQAVRSGRSHRWVSARVLALNAALVLLAAIALYAPHLGWVAVALAYIFSVLLCVYFANNRTSSGSGSTAEILAPIMRAPHDATA